MTKRVVVYEVVQHRARRLVYRRIRQYRLWRRPRRFADQTRLIRFVGIATGARLNVSVRHFFDCSRVKDTITILCVHAAINTFPSSRIIIIIILLLLLQSYTRRRPNSNFLRDNNNNRATFLGKAFTSKY